MPTEVPEGPQPESQDAGERVDALRARILALQTQMQEQQPDEWKTFVAWWDERQKEEGWLSLAAVPYESLKSIVSRMERQLAGATA